nr:unnamed protein product [Digitaria exilis]
MPCSPLARFAPAGVRPPRGRRVAETASASFCPHAFVQAFRTVTSRATAHCCLAPRSAIMTNSLGTGRSRAAPPRSHDARSLRAKEHCGGSPAITPQSSSPNRLGAHQLRVTSTFSPHARSRGNSLLFCVPKHSTESLITSLIRRLQPPAARTEPSFKATFVLTTFPSFQSPTSRELSPTLRREIGFSPTIPNSPARNRIFPKSAFPAAGARARRAPTSSPPPKPTKLSDSFPESYGCSRTPSFPATASNLAEIEPAATAPLPHVAGVLRASSGLPTVIVQLVVSHWFFSPPLRPPFTAPVVGRVLPQGALIDGFYDLVPIDGEENLEGGRASVDADSPERSSQLEQGGKPRSIT